MAAKKVLIYHAPGCAGCEAAMDFLYQQGICFTPKDITHGAEALDEFDQLHTELTPTIVVDGEVIVGFDRRKLEDALMN